MLRNEMERSAMRVSAGFPTRGAACSREPLADLAGAAAYVIAG